MHSDIPGFRLPESVIDEENIITAVVQGHEAAISIDRFCSGLPVAERPAPRATLPSQKMGIHAWIYSNRISEDARQRVVQHDGSARRPRRPISDPEHHRWKLGTPGVSS